jgi:hypothetical protein
VLCTTTECTQHMPSALGPCHAWRAGTLVCSALAAPRATGWRRARSPPRSAHALCLRQHPNVAAFCRRAACRNPDLHSSAAAPPPAAQRRPPAACARRASPARPGWTAPPQRSRPAAARPPPPCARRRMRRATRARPPAPPPAAGHSRLNTLSLSLTQRHHLWPPAREGTPAARPAAHGRAQAAAGGAALGAAASVRPGAAANVKVQTRPVDQPAARHAGGSAHWQALHAMTRRPRLAAWRACRGATQLASSPWPSLPARPSPQVKSSPPDVTAAAWNSPHATCPRMRGSPSRRAESSAAQVHTWAPGTGSSTRTGCLRAGSAHRSGKRCSAAPCQSWRVGKPSMCGRRGADRRSCQAMRHCPHCCIGGGSARLHKHMLAQTAQGPRDALAVARATSVAAPRE